MKVQGASATLHPPDSDVTIHIPENVHGILVAHAHTDFQPFREFVPESECFVSPLAEVHYIPRDKNQKQKMFTIRIPRDIEDKDAWANVQVRRVDIHRLVRWSLEIFAGKGLFRAYSMNHNTKRGWY